jgi:hypothetical protein
MRNFLAAAIFIAAVAFSASAQAKQPRTVRDFFNLLPQKYFALEGCRRETDKNCERARREYIESYLEVEDTANGYWKSGCDGGQSCLTMALFRRPDDTYLVALMTEFDSDTDNYFLEYRNGNWTNVSAQVVPNFSDRNIYELPRRGTSIGVYAKDYVDEFPQKGKKLYDLVWKNGKFSVKR